MLCYNDIVHCTTYLSLLLDVIGFYWTFCLHCNYWIIAVLTQQEKRLHNCWLVAWRGLEISQPHKKRGNKMSPCGTHEVSADICSG